MVMSLIDYFSGQIWELKSHKTVSLHVSNTPLKKMASSLLLDNVTKLEVPRKLTEKSNGFAIDIGRTSIEE